MVQSSSFAQGESWEVYLAAPGNLLPSHPTELPHRPALHRRRADPAHATIGFLLDLPPCAGLSSSRAAVAPSSPWWLPRALLLSQIVAIEGILLAQVESAVADGRVGQTPSVVWGPKL